MGLVASCSGLLGRRGSPPPPPPPPIPAPSAPPLPPSAEDGPKPELALVFRQIDTDGDGRISAAEMRESCGCTAAEAEEMVAAADRDGDGFISLEELGALMEEGRDDQSDALALRAAFAEYDEDGDGFITAEELRRALRRLGIGGEEITPELCAVMVAAVDSNGDGVVSFDEFKAMMAIKPA
ncbi:hypothetical protein ACP4OV_000979 [Aristida adscensionis]